MALRMLRWPLAAAILSQAILISHSPAAVVFVMHDSPGPTRDGSTWSTAYQSVREAINAAQAGDEIWVSSGVYTGLIILKDGVSLYGGFAGTETSRSQRDWKSHSSVLFGNRLGSVVTVPGGVTPSTVLDGFTISGGEAESGGGIYCSSSRPVIRNNVITGNTATYGAAIRCNYASATIINNVLSHNAARERGGGITVCGASPVIRGNLIVSNQSGGSGGGIYVHFVLCYPDVINNTIASNAAAIGGGIALEEGCAPCVANNIIAMNSSGIYGDGVSPSFWNNTFFQNGSGTFTGSIPDPIGTQGNRVGCPRFLSPETGDYHLWSSSPCIGTGDVTYVPADDVDLDGRNRVQDGSVDIGAYRYASASLTPGHSVAQAMKIAGGLTEAAEADLGVLDVEHTATSSGRIDVVDAVRLARIAARTDRQ